MQPSFGLPSGGIVGTAIFQGGIPIGDTQRWTTNHRHIFAQVDYRINEPVVLSPSIMAEDNVIRMPEHIFEAIAVTTVPIDIPPKIAPASDYTVNVFGRSSDYAFEVQFQLVFETSVVWSVSSVGLAGFELIEGYVTIDENGTLKISNIVELADKVIKVTVKASNSLGEDSKAITITIVNDVEAPSTTPGPKDEVLPSKARLEDILWRELFELRGKIPDNLFNRVVVNRLGIYYRMDNGSSKGVEIAGQSGGIGSSYGGTHNDGSSKLIEFKLSEDIQMGDTVYVTYAAAKEHYLRQCVHIRWFAIDAGIMGFVAYPTSISAANYRFYKWKTQGVLGQPSGTSGTTDLEGWRIVESFNYSPEMITFLKEGVPSPILTSFIQDEQVDGPIKYIPVSADINDIEDSMTNTESLVFQDWPFISNGFSDSHSYMIEDFPLILLPPEDLAKTWYWKYINSSFSKGSYADLTEHLAYNVNDKALSSRDVDKMGYPINFAEAVDEAIKSGEETFIPFRDARGWPVDDPNFGPVSDMLDSGNYAIEPINSSPRIISTSNALAIDSPIGLFPHVGAGQIYAEFASNVIQEPFKKGTRILVETKPLGRDVVLSVNCKGGGEGFVNAIQDVPFRNAFIFSNNSDSFLIRRHMRYDYYYDDLEKLDFLPGKGGINYDDITINVHRRSNPVVGLAGLIGDSPGMFPGRVVSFYQYANNDAFVEYYMGEPQTRIETKKEIGATTIADDVHISLGEFVYTGSLRGKIVFGFSGSFKKGSSAKGYEEKIRDIWKSLFPSRTLIIMFLSGNNIESIIDNVPFRPVFDIDVVISTTDEGKSSESSMFKFDVEQPFEMPDYYWLKGDSIRIKFPFDPQDFVDKLKDITDEDGDGLSTGGRAAAHSISAISIIGLKDEYAQDFTDNEATPQFLTSNFPLWKGGNFVKTDYASSHIDDVGIIYVLFDDEKGGISCVSTEDEGFTWTLQYGVIEPLEAIKNRFPFCVKSSIRQQLFLFFVRNGVLYVGVLPLGDFELEDAFKIVDPDEENEEDETFFGKIRNTAVYVAAGNNNTDNIEFIGKYDRYKLGLTTIFSNVNFETPYFSAYQDTKGELKLFFIDDNHKVQCHYSTDNGLTWNDLWVCMKYGIDGIQDEFKNFGKTSDSYPLGVNPHSQNVPTEEQIDSPYAFYSSFLDRVYLFYVYKECLLCKLFDNLWSANAVEGGNEYDNFVDSLAKNKSIFVDGNASRIADEIGENIIMTHEYALGNFTDARAIESQRVHAIQLQNGNIKVHYKTQDGAIRGAWQDGYTWTIEDMMHTTIL